MGLRVGIVGAGRVTEEYWLPALADIGARTWLCDTNPARLKSLCRGLLVRECGSIEALVGRRPDLVIVATPARTHAGVVDQVADTCRPGEHMPVLLEKPPVVSSQELRRLLGRQEEGRIRPAGAFLRRALPAPRLARRLFSEWISRFGRLRRIEVWEGRPYSWRSQGTRSGADGLESMLFDELSHSVDLMIFMTAAEITPPKRVAVVEHTPMNFAGRCQLGIGPDLVDVRLRGSRDKLLANAVTFFFDGASVSVEQGFGGGIVVRPRNARPEPVDPGPAPSLGEIFGNLAVLASKGALEAGTAIAPLASWASPLAILESLHSTAAEGAAR